LQNKKTNKTSSGGLGAWEIIEAFLELGFFETFDPVLRLALAVYF
jgi:hypothetical protein